MQEMRRAETLWLRINGVLLILVGLTLVASPRITYCQGKVEMSYSEQSRNVLF